MPADLLDSFHEPLGYPLRLKAGYVFVEGRVEHDGRAPMGAFFGSVCAAAAGGHGPASTFASSVAEQRR
ncbi:hypothetical protein BZY94_21040 [Burkholderia territorii]|nr:hypothetical protein BZY94_21040 [Burkholderia territorii]